MCYTSGMDIIISHESALEYWRLYGVAKIDPSARLRRATPPADLPAIKSVRGQLPSGLTFPVNLMVRNQNTKRKSETIKLHVYTDKMPDGCFVSVGGGVAVCSPSFLFLQMAGELPLVKLIELGLELCGTYSLPVIDDYYGSGEEAVDRTLYKQPQLAGVKTLTSFVTRMEGFHGRKKALRALRYIADGSASPMETILFMLLTLPHKLGGYGLPAPELNRQVDLMTTYKNRLKKAYYKCDFFWSKAGLAVEYDSDYYHTGADRIASDSKRRFDLAAHGVTVITVTTGQIRNDTAFESLAKLIAEKLRRRLRYENPQQFIKAKRELRKLLL